MKKIKKNLSIPTDKPMIETCHLGEWSKYYEIDAQNEKSYIHEHLTTLNFIVKEFGCKQVLEIGTGPGESLQAMLEDTEAVVTTIDIEECMQAKDKLMSHELDGRAVFIRGKSDKLNIFGTFDLVLIDGGHSFEQVTADIEAFAWLVKPGGFMILHDTCNPAWVGVKQAVTHFWTNTTLWNRYDWYNCNGLTVFRRKIRND